MEININNYEIFIIDYLDNKLPPFETAQLIIFLEQNPHIKNDFEGLENIKVKPSLDESYGFSDVLLHPADYDADNLSLINYSHYFIAATEGDLSSIGKQRIDVFIKKYHHLEREYLLFAACKLKPDPKITFSNKKSLKNAAKPLVYKMFTHLTVAASVLILISIFLHIEPESTESLDKVIKERVNTTSETKTTVGTKEEKEVNTPAILSSKKHEEVKLSGKTNTSTKAVKDANNKAKSGSIERNAPINKMVKLKYTINNTGLITENQTKNFYTNLYEDIKLSQELSIASKEEQIETPVVERNQGSFKTGRILNSIIASGNQVAEQVPESLSGWLIADLGIKGFNLLTNNKFKIERQFSSNGNIESVKLRNQKD
jgi:hypothetical protein